MPHRFFGANKSPKFFHLLSYPHFKPHHYNHHTYLYQKATVATYDRTHGSLLQTTKMPSEIRGADQGMLRLRKVKKLMEELGFKDSQEFKAFLESRKFKPFFDEYATQYIYPQQERARAEGSYRPRGVGLEHVERRLLSGERPGHDKFSCRRPDKSQWDDIDHCALMLFEIRDANTRSVEGIFYRKNLSEHEMHIYIWALVKHVEFNTAPSRRKGAKLTGNDLGNSNVDAPAGGVDAPAGGVDPLASGADPPAGNTGPPGDDTGPPGDDTDSPAIFAPIAPAAEECSVGDSSIKFSAEEDAKPNRQLLDFLKTDEGSFTGDRALTNGQRMCIENNGEPFDITSRYWKAWTISEVIGNQDDLSNLRSRHDYASNLNDLALEEQSQFHQEITRDLDEDLIVLPEFTEPVRMLHDQQQTWMDNVLFQREDLEAACELLSIPWNGENTIFRTNQMSLSTKMEFWQPVAVKAIADFVDQEPALGGCVLADMMGIGKTWVVICFLMLVGALTVPRRLQYTIAYIAVAFREELLSS